MRRIMALSILFVAIGAIMLAPTYLKGSSVSAVGPARFYFTPPTPVTNGLVRQQALLDLTFPGTQLQGPERMVDMDYDAFIFNRTNLCPNPQNASFTLKLIDNNTGATLLVLTGTIPPGGETNFSSLGDSISPDAYGANGIIQVRGEIGVDPFAEEYTGMRLIQKYHQGGTPSVPGDILFNYVDLQGP